MKYTLETVRISRLIVPKYPHPITHGAQQEGPARGRSAMGRLGEEVGLIFDGATRAKEKAIRHMTRTGRPAGNAAFVDLVERLTDRDLSTGKPGRPVIKDNQFRYYLPGILTMAIRKEERRK